MLDLEQFTKLENAVEEKSFKSDNHVSFVISIESYGIKQISAGDSICEAPDSKITYEVYSKKQGVLEEFYNFEEALDFLYNLDTYENIERLSEKCCNGVLEVIEKK